MKKLQKLLLVLVLGFSLASPVFAGDGLKIRSDFNEALKAGNIVDVKQDPANQLQLSTAVGNAINALLTFLGTIVLVLVIYAGFLWATAAGNEEKVKKAKNMILGGVIGLTIIITSAYLVGFVVDQIAKTLVR